MNVPLHLEHASLTVPDIADAARWLRDELGLLAKVTPADSRHSRVYLDLSYLEVSSREPVTAPQLGLFFLRFEDPQALVRHLELAGLEYRFSEYEGVDGRWDDVEVIARDVPMPILVRRTHPPDVAAAWPPRLATSHPSGATWLAAVVVKVADLAEAVGAYSRLLGCKTESLGADCRTRAIPAATGTIVLEQGENEGLAGLILGRSDYRNRAGLNYRSVGWSEAAARRGIRIGFA